MRYLNIPCRFFSGLLLAVLFVGLVVWMHPEQGGVIIYKAALLFVAGVAGYVLDRIAFPYARPDSYLEWPWREEQRAGFRTLAANHKVAAGYEHIFAASLIRRAIIMGAAILGLGMAL